MPRIMMVISAYSLGMSVMSLPDALSLPLPPSPRDGRARPPLECVRACVTGYARLCARINVWGLAYVFRNEGGDYSTVY